MNADRRYLLCYEADRGDVKPELRGRASNARGRFCAAATLDATRLSCDVDVIASSVVQNLTGLLDAKVKVTMEIEAEIPSGAPDNIVRTVTENCRTLKFKASGFEES